MKTTVLTMALAALVLMLGSCAAKTRYRDACGSELRAAKKELSISKSKGFEGSISYTKALSFITAAMTMQTVENFDDCYENAHKARFYIRQSKKGQ